MKQIIVMIILFILSTSIILYSIEQKEYIILETKNYYNDTKQFNEYKTTVYNHSTYQVNKINFEVRRHYPCTNPERRQSIGMSMFPFMSEPNYYYVEKIDYKDLKVGDIIVYESQGEMVHHAITNYYSDYLYAAGYNTDYEEMVYPDQVKFIHCDLVI